MSQIVVRYVECGGVGQMWNFKAREFCSDYIAMSMRSPQGSRFQSDGGLE